MSHLVIVESPAKATTINKYLGNQYHVIASYGHIRDLPPKDGSVNPDDRFSMLWDLSDRAKKVVSELVKLAKQSDSIILATDPDREGEAISWHIQQVLQEKKAIKAGVPVTRVVFNEITKTAVQTAMANPRTVSQPLVDAYLARRALDYLVGFNLSPVLWRKLPGSKSAGRVQSVSLRLICDREEEIEQFKSEEYWSVDGLFQPESKTKIQPVLAQLTQVQGKKLTKLSLNNQASVNAVEALVEADKAFSVSNIDAKTVQRNPYPPFITSTLQQEAARKLGFSVTRTMQTAQKLYEGFSIGGEVTGLITYMRTDGMNLSVDAVTGIRQQVLTLYGQAYLPAAPRLYKTKAKNAQEAHEAIRPTDVVRTPKQMRAFLNDDQYRLYDLIWKRTMACQMANVVLDQTGIDIINTSKTVQFRATGSVIKFDGFYRAYREQQESFSEAENAEADGTKDDEDRELPALSVGQVMHLNRLKTEQHFTKPPARYSEASLVKRMEELGIGRPSTYASIIKILQERLYVRMEARRFFPEDRGRLVTTFLKQFFAQYVEYDFTANLEQQLDDITSSSLSYLQVLQQFWEPFIQTVKATQSLTLTDVLNALDETLEEHFFPSETDEATGDPIPAEVRRACPTCKTGRLGLKLGKFGAFIGCSAYPTCKHTKQLAMDDAGKTATEGGESLGFLDAGPLVLGEDEATGKAVTLQKGPYGVYVQLGETEELPPAEGSRAKKPKIVKPKRASLPAGVQPSGVTLAIALKLLALPREVGATPAGEKIQSNNGRFGPYIQIGATFISLKAPDDIFTISEERAVELYETSGKKAVSLGMYGKAEVYVKKGRFGHFLAYKKDKFPIPKTTDIATFTLEQATALLEVKLAKPSAGKASTAKTKAPASRTKKATSTASALSVTKVVKGKTTRTASKASKVRGKATATETKATPKKKTATSSAAASFHAATGF
jgi:DNA topoisomerase I